MKFSELSTDSALDVFCEVVPYIERIANDDELIAELKKEVDIGDDATNVEKTAVVLSKLNVVAPIVLKKRRDDVLGIIAAINGVDVEAVKKQNFLKTLIQVREVINDKDFMDFFKSFVAVAQGA